MGVEGRSRGPSRALTSREVSIRFARRGRAWGKFIWIGRTINISPMSALILTLRLSTANRFRMDRMRFGASMRTHVSNVTDAGLERAEEKRSNNSRKKNRSSGPS